MKAMNSVDFYTKIYVPLAVFDLTLTAHSRNREPDSCLLRSWRSAPTEESLEGPWLTTAGQGEILSFLEGRIAGYKDEYPRLYEKLAMDFDPLEFAKKWREERGISKPERFIPSDVFYLPIQKKSTKHQPRGAF